MNRKQLGISHALLRHKEKQKKTQEHTQSERELTNLTVRQQPAVQNGSKKERKERIGKHRMR